MHLMHLMAFAAAEQPIDLASAFCGPGHKRSAPLAEIGSDKVAGRTSGISGPRTPA